jgi:hypothetical protein
MFGSRYFSCDGIAVFIKKGVACDDLLGRPQIPDVVSVWTAADVLALFHVLAMIRLCASRGIVRYVSSGPVTCTLDKSMEKVSRQSRIIWRRLGRLLSNDAAQDLRHVLFPLSFPLLHSVMRYTTPLASFQTFFHFPNKPAPEPCPPGVVSRQPTTSLARRRFRADKKPALARRT